MLTDEAKRGIRDFYGRIAAGLPGFRGRFGQREMVGAIASVLANARATPETPARGQNIAVIEGKTGVGKTVGYLTPAIVMAKALGKKLVVSTATVALQEQLFRRDIPAIAKFCDTTLTYALAKGRARFVCPSRLDKFAGAASQDALFGEAVWDRRPEAKEVEQLRKLALDLEQGAWNGDRDALTESMPQDAWGRISTDSFGCTKRRCPRFKECPYYKERSKTIGVDVIVANHDLVLSVIASGSELLPAPADTIYIFDEAHHLPGVAIERFSVSAAVAGSTKWLDKVPATVARLVAVGRLPAEFAASAETSVRLTESLDELMASLRHSELFTQGPIVRFKHGQLDSSWQEIAAQLAAKATQLERELGLLAEKMGEVVEQDPTKAPSIEKHLVDFGFFQGRVANLAWALQLLEQDPEASGEPLAKWIAREEKTNDYKIHVAPISAAKTLSHVLWEAAAGCVLTSATLSTLGEFEFFLERSGLSRYPEVTARSVASPFDYPAQGQLILPRMKADPSDVGAHTEEIVANLSRMIPEIKAGALVLFASKSQMLNVREKLSPHHQQMILCQGTEPRSVLLDKHRAAIERGRPSILFGLASFGEGMDLPGKYCEWVFIAKIPFSPPNSPLDEAIAERITQQGGDPFKELSLPKAGLTLVQWVGRLIRTENDTGTIVIFDRRLRSKSYGKKLLASLPDFAVS